MNHAHAAVAPLVHSPGPIILITAGLLILAAFLISIAVGTYPTMRSASPLPRHAWAAWAVFLLLAIGSVCMFVSYQAYADNEIDELKNSVSSWLDESYGVEISGAEVSDLINLGTVETERGGDLVTITLGRTADGRYSVESSTSEVLTPNR